MALPFQNYHCKYFKCHSKIKYHSTSSIVFGYKFPMTVSSYIHRYAMVITMVGSEGVHLKSRFSIRSLPFHLRGVKVVASNSSSFSFPRGVVGVPRDQHEFWQEISPACSDALYLGYSSCGDEKTASLLMILTMSRLWRRIPFNAKYLHNSAQHLRFQSSRYSLYIAVMIIDVSLPTRSRVETTCPKMDKNAFLCPT